MRLSAPLVFVVGLALLAPCIARRDLWAPDEPRHAEVARTMVVTGDWTVPHLNGEIYPDKPPPPFWLMAGAMKVFGTHDWAARIPTVVAAAGILALTVMIADLLGLGEAALLAVLILATAFRSSWLFQRVSLDVLMTFFVCVAIWAWLRHWRGRGNATVNGMLCFGAIALGGSMKGPLALVIVLCAAVGHAFATRTARKLVDPKFLVPGMFTLVAVVAAWAIPLWNATDAAYHGELFFKQSAGRIANAWNHEAPPWYYLYDFPTEFMPWTPLLGIAIVALLKLRPASSRDAWTLLFAWTVPAFVFLSIVQSKRGNYLLPLYPAFALLASVGLVEIVKVGDRFRRPLRAVAWIGVALLALAGLAIGASAFLPPLWERGIRVPASAAFVGFAIGGIFVVRACTRMRDGAPSAALLQQAIGTTLLLVVVGAFVFPAIDAAKSGRPIAEELRDALPAGAYVPMLGLRAEEYCFYSGLACREMDSREDFVAALMRPGLRFALADAKELGRLKKKGMLPANVVERSVRAIGGETDVVVLEVMPTVANNG